MLVLGVLHLGILGHPPPPWDISRLVVLAHFGSKNSDKKNCQNL